MRFAIFLLLALMACAPAPGTTPPEWQPNEAQKRAAVLTAERYINAVDTGDYATAEAMLEGSVKARIAPGQFAEAFAQNRQQYGRIVARQVRVFVWSKGSLDVGTGVAAAVEFDGRAERAPVVCGYLVLAEAEPGMFRVFRDDTTYVEARVLQSAGFEERRALFDRPGCRRFITR